MNEITIKHACKICGGSGLVRASEDDTLAIGCCLCGGSGEVTSVFDAYTGPVPVPYTHVLLPSGRTMPIDEWMTGKTAWT